MRKKGILIIILLISCTTILANNYFLFETEDVSIYPIPAKKHFTVEVPTNYNNGKIIITNVVGKEMMIIDILNETKIKVLTDTFSKGIYFVSIQVNTELVFTKRIVIDK
jgi:Secretion system C-terminal sorting domain